MGADTCSYREDFGLKSVVNNVLPNQFGNLGLVKTRTTQDELYEAISLFGKMLLCLFAAKFKKLFVGHETSSRL